MVWTFGLLDTRTLTFSQTSLAGEGLLGSDRHRVERSRSPGSREDISGPLLVALVASRSTGDRAMVRSSGPVDPVDRSGRRFRSTRPVDRSGPPVRSAGRPVRSAGPVDRSGPPVRSTNSLIIRSKSPDTEDMMKNTGTNVVIVTVEAVHVCKGQSYHHRYLRMTGATTDVVVMVGEVGDTAVLLKRCLFRLCVKSCWLAWKPCREECIRWKITIYQRIPLSTPKRGILP